MHRSLRMLDGLNFNEFVAFLSAFSSGTSLQQKVEFIFKVYDSDGNGKVTFNEMLDIFRDLTGQFTYEQQREKVLTHVLMEAGYTKDSLSAQADFVKVGNILRIFYASQEKWNLKNRFLVNVLMIFGFNGGVQQQTFFW
ncbi:calcineurin subunit B-like isoform X2 [Primulina tabacum]|uniref:calcineurin subunit B-like isoform X2 n=1 Tax=Primulina tabacum TaxID=48773 RepID=UPI003F59EF1D